MRLKSETHLPHGQHATWGFVERFQTHLVPPFMVGAWAQEKVISAL